VAADIDQEIDILTQKIETNRTTILNILAENRALENTVGLLKLKRSGVLSGA
jgi:hypothetical protein